MTPNRVLLTALLLATASLTACADGGSAAPVAPAASAGATALATPGTAAGPSGDCPAVATALLLVSMRTAGMSVSVTLAEQGTKTPREGLDQAAEKLDLPLTTLDEALAKTTDADLTALARSVRDEAAALQQSLRSGTDPAAAMASIEKFAASIDQKTQVLETRCS
ncbi:hypothetical protein [Catellatospora vulcania]|uniref:hypothetical protein n=1 Tax=Catellatospora vulcania TaxID=1460450 RepID=UPI0012D49EC9|nr:hypothetical protein [Catellatospora vulcania]